MTNNEIVQSLRECANSLRRVATRKSIVAEDENDLRLVASSLDHVALEFATRAKQARPGGKPGVDR